MDDTMTRVRRGRRVQAAMRLYACELRAARGDEHASRIADARFRDHLDQLYARTHAERALRLVSAPAPRGPAPRAEEHGRRAVG